MPTIIPEMKRTLCTETHMIRNHVSLVLLLFAVSYSYGQEPSVTDRLQVLGTRSLSKLAMEQGDARRGALLFHQPIYQCSKCHSVSQAESPLGPNLAKWDKTPTLEHLIESILDPSASIREGYQTVSVLTGDGLQHSGVLVERTDQSVTLRSAAGEGKQLTFLSEQLDEVTLSKKSIMPEGLVDQLPDTKQFLDLARYLIEIAEHGPARAAELQPASDLIGLPPLPDYEQHIDHAALIRGFNDDTFDAGERIYNRVCANCHGTHDREGSLPTSPRFASSKLKNGTDPYKLYQTLTHGYGFMVAQRWMVPKQKYAVIHFLREEYFREDNPDLYTEIDDAYLRSLPEGDSLGPDPVKYEPWVAMDYGRSLNHTYEIRVNPGNQVGRDLGRGPRAKNPWADPDPYFAPGEAPNYAYKGIAIRLDSGPGGVTRGKHWVVYDHDTLNMHAAWSGDEFIDYCCIQFDGQHAVHNRLKGELHFENPVGPGWGQPLTGVFYDPRPVGRDGRPYGPLPKTWGEYRGLYHHGEQTILSYRLGSASILESPSVIAGDQPIFVRNFSIGPATHALRLRVAPKGNTVQVRGDAVAETDEIDGFLTVLLSPSEKRRDLQVLVSRDEIADDVDVPAGKDLTTLTHGSAPLWPERVRTPIKTTHDGVFAVDQLTLPSVNPWNAQMRMTGLDFFSDNQRAAICTWDGDVWIVEGIDQNPVRDSDSNSGELVWQRIASGMFQPLGLKIVDDQVFVTCRDQLVALRDLNGDNETDFYECYNNDHQVTEHFHEFAMGLQTDDAGNFYYAKSGRHAKRAVVPHHGTLLRISADGAETDILATGFRAANGVCLNPDGSFFVTDQEGHWNPKNRINWVTEGGFYGNMYSFTDQLDPSDDAMEPPLCWITNAFDRSPAELLWVPKDVWGPFAGKLLSLSYGYGKVFLVPHELVDGQLQGGMIQLPIPDAPSGLVRGRFHPTRGDLYVCGMFSWAGSRQAPGCFQRIRYDGEPAHLPVKTEFRAGEVRLVFSHALNTKIAADARRYSIRTWDLKRTANYGSDHYNEKDLTVDHATVSADGKTVTLTVPDLKPTWGLAIEYELQGANGSDFAGELHGSIHELH